VLPLAVSAGKCGRSSDPILGSLANVGSVIALVCHSPLLQIRFVNAYTSRSAAVLACVPSAHHAKMAWDVFRLLFSCYVPVARVKGRLLFLPVLAPMSLPAHFKE